MESASSQLPVGVHKGMLVTLIRNQLLPRPMDPSVHEKAHLKRGKACYHCRTRKTRCDGALPSCGPCVRSECVDDCEYVSLGQKARVQILQEQIMDIEAKIRRRANDKRQSAPKRKEKSRDASLSASISPSSRSSSSMSSLPCASSPADSFSPRSPPSLSSTSPSSPQARDPIEPFPPEAFTEVIPLHVAHVLFVMTFLRLLSSVCLPWLSWDTFFAHATDFCFFLDEALNKFRPIAGRPSCMSPALTATIYLLSAHILAHPSMDNLESFLVSTACNLLPKELAMPTVNVAEVLQAELLLAQYFFARDRHTEARFHMSVALGLAFGCGLPEQVCPGLDPIRSRTAYLFLLSLDNAWSTALGYASHEPLSSALRDCECKVLNDVWSTSGFPGHAVLLTKSVSLWQGVEELITSSCCGRHCPP
ncbi:unnamed protein product [Mycena citricolor]|uniref:Zn(2)-C6 fungal-type domain-containing protein n=1 Tax=Mycena citricolor TaxID=2018698 RepID=A0AAD2JV81_9AGAR|nr:unnamed protein product [Mycena citricolor]